MINTLPKIFYESDIKMKIGILFHLLSLLSENIDFISDLVQLEAVDITTLTGGVFFLGDRTDLEPKWESADDNDRNFGYLADRVTGYFEGGSDYGKVLY